MECIQCHSPFDRFKLAVFFSFFLFRFDSIFSKPSFWQQRKSLPINCSQIFRLNFAPNGNKLPLCQTVDLTCECRDRRSTKKIVENDITINIIFQIRCNQPQNGLEISRNFFRSNGGYSSPECFSANQCETQRWK